MVIETILSVFLGVHAIHGDGDGGSGTEDPRAPGPSSSASRQQLRRPRERSRSGERVEDDCNKRFRWTSEASVFDVGDVGDVEIVNDSRDINQEPLCGPVELVDLDDEFQDEDPDDEAGGGRRTTMETSAGCIIGMAPLLQESVKGQTNCQNFLFPAAKTMFETIGQSKPDDPEHFRQLLMSVRRARPKPGFVDFDTLSRIVRSASSPMEARALLMVHMLLPVRMGELWNALFFVDVVKSRKKVNYFHRMGCEGLGEFVFWVYKTRGIGVQKLPVPEELRLVLLSLRMDDEEDGEFVFGSFETRTAFNAHVKDVLGALNPAVRYNVLRHAVVTKLATLCTTFAEFARIAAYMLHLPYSAWYYYCHVDIAARVVGAHAGVTFLGGIGRGLGEGGIGAQLSRELGVLGSGVEWLEELRLSVAVVQEPVEGGAWLGSSVADLALEMEAGPGSALEVGTAPGGMADLALEMEAGPGSALEVGTAPGGMADLALEMEAGLGSATEVGAAPGGLADLALDVEGGPVGVAKVRAGVRGVHGVSRHDGGPKDGNQGAPHTKALKERYRRDCINKRCSELAQLIYAGEKPKTDKLSILRDTVRVVKQMRVACGGGPVGVAQVGAGGGGPVGVAQVEAGGGGPVGVVQGPGEAQLGDGGEGASGDDGEQDGKREAAHKKALREKHRRCRINERFSELAQLIYADEEHSTDKLSILVDTIKLIKHRHTFLSRMVARP